MKRIALLFPVIAFLGLSSCDFVSKEEYQFVPYSNSPVQNGAYLELGFEQVYDDVLYEITTPSGYVVDQSYYEVSGASFVEEGEYTLRAFDDEHRVTRSVFVEVIPDSVDCTPPVNTLRSNFSNVSMDFTNVSGKVFNDTYEIKAYSSTGDVYLDFYTEEKPRGNRTYESTFGSFGQAYQVSVRATAQGVGAINGRTKQKVHVYQENGSTYLSLCDFKMTTSTGGFEVIANINLRLD
jgi:hypothetical protein